MSETIVFFGSGPVAASSLKLLAEQFHIEAIVTKPKPQHHHGDFPVITLAEQLGITSLTAANRKELSALINKSYFKSKVAVLIDFGIIVNQDVIDSFPLGIINSHFSLLPEWRGADPISFAILSGQEKTGVSLMLIDAGMDTGKIIAQKSHPLTQDVTTPELTSELINLSNAMLAEHLPEYVKGNLKPRNQPHPDRATYSRKLTKEDGVMNFNKPAHQLDREIRAFIEWPKSRAVISGKEVVVTKAEVVDLDGDIGKIQIKDKQIIIFTSEGALSIKRLKPAGKQEMTAESFINGYMKIS